MATSLQDMNRIRLKLSSAAWYTFVFFVLTKAFAGPIGIVIPYLRFFPIALMMALLLIQGYRMMLSNISFSFIFGVLILYIFIGVSYNSLVQSLFGIYVFIPFLFSFLFHEEILNKILSENNKLNTFLFFTCAIGIFYVNIYGASWIGMEQEIGGVTKEVSKAWSSDGIIRNPGFTSGSVTAASIMLISFSLLGSNFIKKRNYFQVGLYLVIALYAIYLTTTKTMIISIIFVLILMLIPAYFCRLLVKGTLIFSALFSYFFMFSEKNPGYYTSDNTFMIRMFSTWPNAISILDDKLSLFIGKGFGAIGTPTYLFNARMTSPADNFFVYLYVIFGVISVAFIMLLFLKLIATRFYLYNKGKSFYILLFVIFMGALTYNLIESTIYACYGGVLIGAIWFSGQARKNFG